MDFIIVGGAAATIHGSGTTTEDLDIVPSSAADNIDRLLELLQDLDAEFRHDLAKRHLRPERSHLEAGGQLLLSTTLGPLDLLMRLHDGRDYEALSSCTQTFTDGDLDIEVIRLPELIDIKRQAGRDKDKAVLPILVALLQQLGSGTTSPSPDRPQAEAEDGTRGKLAADDSDVLASSAKNGGQDGGSSSAG